MNYFLSTLVSWIIGLASVVIVPIAIPLRNRTTGHLRKLFYWWDTPDQALPGDLNKPLIAAMFKKHGFFLTSYYWLAWRNRAYGFSRTCGVRDWLDATLTTNGRYPSDDTSERGTGRYSLTTATGRRYWELYGVYGSDTFGIRIRFGWKLQPLFQSSREQWPQLFEKTATGSRVFHISIRKFQN